MAYRQLCAVALVTFGLLGVGCAGNSGGSAADPAPSDEAPPSADDTPPSGSEDAPPSSDDAPPSSSETPPGSADNHGGRIRQLCESACQVIDKIRECVPDGMGVMGGEVCSNGGCSMAVDPGVMIPCIDQIEAMFGCIAGLPDVCVDEQAEQCTDEVQAYQACVGEEPGPGPGPGPDPNDECMPETGCFECADTCDECLCDNAELGEDAAAELCLTECANR